VSTSTVRIDFGVAPELVSLKYEKVSGLLGEAAYDANGVGAILWCDAGFVAALQPHPGG
jgi:hypothetical protein